jgi:glutamate dehydrogenase/leucine dehydrogenase
MSDILSRMAAGSYEAVVHAYDRRTGLRAIVAIHDTTLGPALGGIRARQYRSEDEALVDVLRLAEAMTYKASLAGLDLGGGKAVVLGEPERGRGAVFQALGRVIERLGGAYVPTEDMGTTTADLVEVRRTSRYGVGLPPDAGGGGDPSPTTAWGVLHGMRAALAALGETDSLRGRSVAVQGVGKVGLALVRFLTEAGASVSVADTDARRVTAAVREFGATAVPLDDILRCGVDILAPCAAGAVLNEATIPQLRCRVVAGGANNQLATDTDGERLAARGILYAPDFAVNAGGLIHVAEELNPAGHDAARARARAEGIYETVGRVLAEARATGELPDRAALRMARERIERARPSTA